MRLRFPSSGVFTALIISNISVNTAGPFVKRGVFKEESGTDRLYRKFSNYHQLTLHIIPEGRILYARCCGTQTSRIMTLLRQPKK